MLLHFARFRRWFVARSPLWTQLRVAGVAVRTSDGWIARRVLVTLGAPVFSDRILKTENTLIFERHLPATSLARILFNLVHGRLPAQLELGVPVRVFSFPPSSVGTDEQPARTGFVFTPLERFARFELKMSGGGSRPGGSVFTHELHEQWDREMRAQGQGRLGDVVRALGLSNNDNELRAGADECIVSVVACIPARIAAFTQTADRAQAVVTTEVAPEIAARVRLLMTSLSAGWRDPVPGSIDVNGRSMFALSENDDVQFTLLFDEYPVQCERFERVPCTRPGLRERAVAWLEDPDRSLLRDGLLQAGSPDANAFERSVIHLFGLLGFSGLWWGPNRQHGTPKIPMPKNASDCIVFSSDDAVVGLFECTVDAPGRDKTLKLIKRAQQLQRELRSATGESSLGVVPVLAAASHRDDIANVVRELCETDGLVLLSADKLENLHSLVKQGATDAEISAALPEPLRAGLAADRLFSRVF